MRRMRFLLSAFAGAFVLMMNSACAARGSATSWEDDLVREGITLEVDNQNFHDATLYATKRVDDSYKKRIGVVGGLSEKTFRFWWQYQELRIVIDFLASRTTFSCTVQVSPGDIVGLVIGAHDHRKEPFCNW